MNKNLVLQTASNSAPEYNPGITIKSTQEIEAMRKAGRVVAKTIELLKQLARPGVTTKYLDQMAEKEILRLGGKPTFKGYRGFPGSICTSVGEEIVHGLPGSRILHDGELLKVDVGATVDGFIGDSAVTIGIGDVSDEARNLMDVTATALKMGILAARVGARTGDIGAAIEEYVAPKGYGLVREYVGHGVGRFLHEEPAVPNYGPGGKGAKLVSGMAIAIEPMVNIGGWETRLLNDQWTVVTEDGSLSAHFEHTILISEEGPEILTSVNGGSVYG